MKVKTFTPEQLKAQLIKAAIKATRHDAVRKKKRYITREARVFTHTSVVPSCYKVRAGKFVANNWTFNPQTMEAFSFRWWAMLTVINGKLVRNAHQYSQATSHHQRGLNRCLTAMGVVPDVILHVRSPITQMYRVQDEILTDWAEAAVSHKYSRDSKGKSWLMKSYERDMKRLSKAKIGLRFSKTAMKKALKAAEVSRAKALKWKRENALSQRNILIIAGGLQVKFHSVELWGEVSEMGHHCKPSILSDIQRAVESCERDLFTTLHVYLKRAPKSAAVVPARPALKLVGG